MWFVRSSERWKLVVAAATWPLVHTLGQGDEGKGFFMTALLFAVVAVVLFFNGWAHTRERVQANEGKPVPVKKGLKSILNLPWVLLLILAIVANLCTVIKQTSTLYYLRYYLGKPEIDVPAIDNPYPICVYRSHTVTLSIKKDGEEECVLAGIAVATVGSIIVIISETNIVLLFAGTVLTYMGIGVPAGLLGAMFADTVDYAEWKSGVRATGLVYSACSLGIKIGQGLGGAVCAMILTLGNYVPNVEQSASALAAIKFNFAWIGLIACVLLVCYPLVLQSG